MSQILTIARREIAGYFFSPIAYLVLFLFLLYMGIIFGLIIFAPGRLTEFRDLVAFSRGGLFIIVPLMTMSLLADEYKSGRIEMLRTSPLTEADLVLGKFFGALFFYCILLASTLAFLVLLLIFGRPDFGAVFSCYLGMLLLGCLYIAIGLFFSSCTQNQIVAALAGLLTLAFLTFIGDFATSYFPPAVALPAWLGSLALPIRPVFQYLGVGTHIADFSKGIFETAHLVYFLAGSIFFLFLTYLVLESRKWRS